jgi:hypothetical protein
MRIRPLYLAVALSLPFGLVALSSEAPTQQLTTASLTPVERPMGDPDIAWLVTQNERLAIERVASEEAARVAADEALRVAAEAAADRVAAEAQAKEARRRSQNTATTVARRYTATTVASSPVVDSGSYATGSLPPKYVSDCESGGNPRAVNPNGHYGKWQFSQSTWESVGGTGRPDHASEAEQDYRASILWNNGRGAGNWECY